jgi:hypothetical protein
VQPNSERKETLVAQTVGELRTIAMVFPDAPKFWIGDWANDGVARFGVTLDEALRAANSVVRGLRTPGHDWSGFRLPRGMRADATSLTLPENLSRSEWEQIGAVLVVVHEQLRTS